MSPGELISADEHLTTCEACRQQAAEAEPLDAAFTSLRDHLRAQALADLGHISYERMEAYVDNELDPTEREILDTHASICAQCAADLRDLQEFKATFSARPTSDL